MLLIRKRFNALLDMIYCGFHIEILSKYCNWCVKLLCVYGYISIVLIEIMLF